MPAPTRSSRPLVGSGVPPLPPPAATIVPPPVKLAFWAVSVPGAVAGGA